MLKYNILFRLVTQTYHEIYYNFAIAANGYLLTTLLFDVQCFTPLIFV